MVLGLKANVSEADHPLLCEGTRRQRGDLAITMLVHYKDDQAKLSKVIFFLNFRHFYYFVYFSSKPNSVTSGILDLIKIYLLGF